MLHNVKPGIKKIIMKIIYGLSLLLVPCFAFPQINISGTIKDSITGKPLPGSSVIIENTFLAAVSDNDGKFILKNVKAGTNIMNVSYVGYAPAKKEIDANENIAIEFSLVKSPVLADEVIISATRASEKSAMAYKNLDKEEIEKRNFGQDVPFILALTPSVVVTSDAGNGVGYTGIRIRGSDATRINVTINGVPVNDAESQQLYWVDLPDIASSIDNLQIQRGIGTSTSGAGAFGGSINIQTTRLRGEPYLEGNYALGSFGTVKSNILFGTGLLNNHWTFDARLSKINSDGYIDRGSSNLKSIYVSEGYYGKKSIVRLNIFSGKEITYQSWYGTPESRIKNDVQGMTDYVIRNGLDDEDSLNLLTSGRTYNYYTYKNQVDDYQQDNYQLHYSLALNDNFTINTSLHYTKGKGYYEEFKKQNNFSDYNLPDVIIADDTIASSNLVRRKWLDNDFYGATYSINYDAHKKVSAILGGGWNQYAGDHFDEIISAQYFPLAEFPYRYESNSALKTDFNIFGKVVYDLSNKINLFADMQYRRVGYAFSGFDKELNYVPENVELNFANPKAGLNWKLNNEHSAYVSVSIGNKEPSRDDYVDSSPLSRPKPENMQDLECGYRLQKNSFVFAFNYYFMNYKDQLVLTGKVNDVGNYTRINVDKSYREGVEGEIECHLLKKINFTANVTISRNKIKAFNQYVDDYDAGIQIIKIFKNTDIAFSPNIIAAAQVSYEPVKNLLVSFITKYVGKQYLDNASDNTKKLKPYSASDLGLEYKLKTKLVKEIGFGLMLNNIFNHPYESNGYTYSYIYGGKEIVENFYYPQSGINILGQVRLKF
jgi:iron complex outermembrane recepter protein